MRVTAGSSGIAAGATTATPAGAAPTTLGAAAAAPVGPAGVQGPPSLTPNAGGALGGAGNDATRMSTVQLTDFWAEVAYAIRTIVGTGEGRNIVISPQSGVVVVRAMPQELRSVEGGMDSKQLVSELQEDYAGIFAGSSSSSSVVVPRASAIRAKNAELANRLPRIR